MSGPGRLADVRYVSEDVWPLCCIREPDAAATTRTRTTGRNDFLDAASTFRRYAAMMYPFLRADSSFCHPSVCRYARSSFLHATQCIAHVDSLK